MRLSLRVPNDATPTQVFAPLHMLWRHVGFPFKRISRYVCISMGLEASGGPYVFYSDYPSEEALSRFILDVLKICPALLMTLRTGENCLHKVLARIVVSRGLGSRVGAIYPRVVVTGEYSSFEDFYKSINKKARNRHRYFIKRRGEVIEDNPLNYVREIMEVNLSQPVRQGKRLPSSYLKPSIVLRSVLLWERLRRAGKLRFYLAVINDVVTGYAVVPVFAGRALFSRFLIHANHLSTGAGNALIIEALKDLWDKADVFQYGYWRGKNPGINSFLEKNGFRALAEPIYLLVRPSLSRFTVKTLMETIVSWSNRARNVPGEGIRSKIKL